MGSVLHVARGQGRALIADVRRVIEATRSELDENRLDVPAANMMSGVTGTVTLSASA